MENKKLKEDELSEEQTPCCFCESYKLQLLCIKYNKKQTQLILLCQNCGRLQVLSLGQGLPEPIKEKPKELSYTG